MKLEFANKWQQMGQLRIKYRNKPEEFVGYIEDVNGLNGGIDDIDVTVKKMVVRSGEKNLFDIDFDNIDSITIRYQGTTEVKTFN